MASEFDFVIVGGGTAGLVLAARLSEDTDAQVLVVEAGDDLSADPRVNVPAMWPTLQGTESDWQLKSVPQNTLGNRELVIPQGRLLGGSSALNAMNFVVGAKEDLDAWAKLGNPGWDWESFSKHLKKTYTMTDGSKTDNNGAIQTNIPEEETKWPKVWRDTLAGLGYPADNDPLSGDIQGAVMYPDAIHPETKTRSYAGNAYLAPARDRPNLTVWTGVTVEKILFDKTAEDAVATGVQYTKDGQSSTVAARKEVILSAGVFHSPKILELSGIGDAKLLQSLGIDVVVDNPFVGENLQHHPMSVLSFETADDGEPGFDTIDALARQDPAAIAAATEAYTTSQRGPFSRTNCNTMAHLPFPGPATDAESLLSTLTTTSDSNTKQTPAYTTAATALAHTALTSPATASGYYVFAPCRANPGPSGRNVAMPSTEQYITVALLLTRPLSRGSVHLTSADPTSTPAIDPRYLTHPLDIEVLARHVQFVDSTLVKAEPLASRLKGEAEGGKRTPEGWPAGLLSRDLGETKRFLRETAGASTLYTSTCSMMPREMGGVVDSALRVYGTRNVRVVDASVMPFITRGDTMATVYGIAEKAAEGIRGGL
ncbi:hypothetical protein C8A01DRAFT_38523 [Parachaetomium inaequale]|uniref:Glucose-methanol-choline oxidoreductase N-terminal domain-containing protein n=1 Tax=Parachaetomium inaequale TaxID=2588326 RepID=A0AAN6PAY3_9PEZI|nr:hypothetical protein C8A01DRAFT_38523 [Parachaetomium inaequale]